MKPFSQQSLYEVLVDFGCCDICCLRFLKAYVLKDYEDIDAFLEKKNCKRIHREVSGLICTACLGVFQEDLFNEIAESIRSNEDIQKYDSETILASVSLPVSLHVRQLSIWVGLINTFGDAITKSECPDIPLKEVMKTLLIPKICTITGKQFEQNGMMVNIFLDYTHEDSEMSVVPRIKPDLFQVKHENKKTKTDSITRNAFERYLVPSKLNLTECNKVMTIPPSAPTSRLTLQKITVTGPTIFVAGRYRKLSRELCQTPWLLGNVKVKELSLQEVIVDGLITYFGSDVANRITFSSSGREDVDVRCLGNGRPFVLEIPDSYKCVLPNSIAEKIEEIIEQSKVVSVKDLQIVTREDTKHVKCGEELKKKMYRALCCCTEQETVPQEVIDKINAVNEEFVIQQATPIRVLHRRTLLKRPRSIYSVKAQLVKDQPGVFIVDVVTQAGTYIKELVHGEFGRTVPSLTSIVGQQLDIISLDVMGLLDLDWPPPRTEKEEINQLTT